MKKLIQNLRKSELGAQYIEYAIVLVLLAVIFVWVGRELGRKGSERGDQSMKSAEHMSGCGTNSLLSSMGANACK